MTIPTGGRGRIRDQMTALQTTGGALVDRWRAKRTTEPCLSPGQQPADSGSARAAARQQRLWRRSCHIRRWTDPRWILDLSLISHSRGGRDPGPATDPAAVERHVPAGEGRKSGGGEQETRLGSKSAVAGHCSQSAAGPRVATGGPSSWLAPQPVRALNFPLDSSSNAPRVSSQRAARAKAG